MRYDNILLFMHIITHIQCCTHFDSRSLTEKSIKNIITEPLTKYTSLLSKQNRVVLKLMYEVRKAAQS